MYAVLIEVNADDSHLDHARKMLPEKAVPMARQAGGKSGYWLAPNDNRGVSVVVFDAEDEARKAASMFQIGQPPMPEAPPGVTVRNVQVCEVLASF